MTSIPLLSTWPTLRWPWLVLGGSALLLEVVALYFQYSMGLEPCVMCIYQRTAVLALCFAAIPAAIFPQYLIARVTSFLGWGIASFWGLNIAREHVEMQNPDNFMLALSCEVNPNFPTWLPLHEWFPAFFEARGLCGDIDWSFINLSMPNWMTIIFSIYIAALLVVVINRLITYKQL